MKPEIDRRELLTLVVGVITTACGLETPAEKELRKERQRFQTEILNRFEYITETTITVNPQMGSLDQTPPMNDWKPNTVNVVVDKDSKASFYVIATNKPLETNTNPKVAYIIDNEDKPLGNSPMKGYAIMETNVGAIVPLKQPQNNLTVLIINAIDLTGVSEKVTNGNFKILIASIPQDRTVITPVAKYSVALRT